MRLLRPARAGRVDPAPIDVNDRTSARRDRARRARSPGPQLALGLARARSSSRCSPLLARRPPRPCSGARPSRSLGGAVAGAGLVGGAARRRRCRSAALARRRAIAVGLVTQSWRRLGRRPGQGDGDRGRARRRAPARPSLVATAALPAQLVGARRGRRRSSSAARSPRSRRCVLDPVFNTFTPLPEGETRSDVLELAERGRRQGRGGLLGRRQPSHDGRQRVRVRALGPTKRVVLFDTLLDRYIARRDPARGRPRARPRPPSRRAARACSTPRSSRRRRRWRSSG